MTSTFAMKSKNDSNLLNLVIISSKTGHLTTKPSPITPNHLITSHPLKINQCAIKFVSENLYNHVVIWWQSRYSTTKQNKTTLNKNKGRKYILKVF